MFRGLEKRHEQQPRLLIRDTRTITQRIKDFFDDPRNTAVILLAAAITTFFFYAFADFILLVCLIMFIYSYTRHSILPFRLPLRAKELDYNDIKPGTNKPNKARGITYFGNDITNSEELWFSNEDMRTHVLIFGSTGSGKTETLVSIAFNALVQGSGFIYVDGKGDNTLFAKIFSMARSMGREDDVLVVNFMTGARDIAGPQERRLSNTLNPFASGSSSMLSQLVVSMMDSASASPDADMWKGRAIVFVESLMKVLVYMRDRGKILLDANTIRNYFILERLEMIAQDRMFPRDNQEPVSLSDAPETVLEPIRNYIINLPGYDKSKKGKQTGQVLEQHGFITMQLTRVFGSLADTYGHILRVNLAEVDLKDVVLNRRILVVLLPALEKAPDELANLGKIIIASLKSMMAAGLGEEVEGDYRDVILRKPTNAPTPYMCILDEYGYYAVKGFAVVPAQARSLGFSAIFAGQDLPAFQKVSKEEAMSIGANTNIKIAMKLEDPVETWDFFNKTAGEAFVTKVDSFQTNPQSMLNNYMDARSASAEKRARIDLMDLKDQREGEAHIFFRSRIVRARMFYANPTPVARMRLNHFLRVEPPPTKKLVDFEQRIERFSELVEKDSLQITGSEFNQDINLLAETYADKAPAPLIERGVAALLSYHNMHNAPEEEEIETTAQTQTIEGLEIPHEEIEEEESGGTEINVFLKPRLLEITRRMVGDQDFPQFSAPVLIKNVCQKKAEFLERLAGRVDRQSDSVAKEIIRDMEIGTQYPPLVSSQPDVNEILTLTRELTASFSGMKEGGSESGEEQNLDNPNKEDKKDDDIDLDDLFDDL